MDKTQMEIQDHLVLLPPQLIQLLKQIMKKIKKLEVLANKLDLQLPITHNQLNLLQVKTHQPHSCTKRLSSGLTWKNCARYVFVSILNLMICAAKIVMAKRASWCALCNVKINCNGFDDLNYVNEVSQKADELLAEAIRREKLIVKAVEKSMQ